MNELKCSECGRPRADVVEQMPMTSLKYRLLSLDLCHGHRKAS